MDLESKKTSLEREQTDESLRTERQKADRAMTERQVSAEDDADGVVRRARRAADAVLDAAREKADERLEQTGTSPAASAAVERERAREDRALHDERATADASLRAERAEHQQVLAQLLPLERERTDRHLLTERVRSDDSVAHRDDFLSIVSHDLRNLLAGVVLNAGMLSEHAGADDLGTRTVVTTERIQRYCARMNRLIGDLLDVGSIESGSLRVTLEPGDLRALLAEACEAFAAAAAARGVVVATAPGDGPVHAAFDHDRAFQVLANLITNAIKFTPAGGTITLGCAARGAEVVVTVTDTGTGIPESMLEAVFERFWQVRKNDRRGVGLGLYISRSIVEAHGGSIRVDSELDHGSTFSFTLQAAAPLSAGR